MGLFPQTGAGLRAWALCRDQSILTVSLPGKFQTGEHGVQESCLKPGPLLTLNNSDLASNLLPWNPPHTRKKGAASISADKCVPRRIPGRQGPAQGTLLSVTGRGRPRTTHSSMCIRLSPLSVHLKLRIVVNAIINTLLIIIIINIVDWL